MTTADELIRLAEARGGKVLGVSPPTPEAPEQPAKPSKYKNVRCEWNGFKFDSKAEMRYARDLAALEQAGIILAWQHHPRFRLGIAEFIYEADAQVYLNDGSTYVVDVKGTRTARFEQVLRLWRRFGPCPLHVVSGDELEIIPGKQP